MFSFSLSTEADHDAARGRRLRLVTAGETFIFLELSIVAELPASVWGLLWINPHCGLQKDIFILFSNMPFIPRPVKGEERRVGLLLPVQQELLLCWNLFEVRLPVPFCEYLF